MSEGKAPELNRRFHRFLHVRQDAILKGWTERVRLEIPTKRLPPSVAAGCLPAILAAITDWVEAIQSGKSAAIVDKHHVAACDRLATILSMDQIAQIYAQLRSTLLELWQRELGPSMLVDEVEQLDSALGHLFSESVVRLEGRRERMLAVLERSSAATLGNVELDTFLRDFGRVLQQANAAIDFVAVLLREGEELRARLTVGVANGVRSKFRIDERLARKIATDQTSLSFSEMPAALDEVRDVLVPVGTRALHAVPLVREESLLGVVYVGSSFALNFSEDDKLFIRTMASRAATVIFQVQLLSERDRAEGERERLLMEARRAVRAREDLLAIVSHELRNPLSTIVLGATEIQRAAGEGGPEARSRKQADAIVRAAGQMTRLVSDLLDLSRIEAGQLLPLEKARWDGAELARQAVEAFEPLANARHLRLETDFGPDPCELSCDGDRIQQVLSNLIGNALKFTREGGVITAGARSLGQEIVFSVADTGEGIPADQLSQIFEPYWQAKAARKGVGLGLSVAQAIVEAHRGRIRVTSALGQGSTFMFTLPAADTTDSANHQTGLLAEAGYKHQ